MIIVSYHQYISHFYYGMELAMVAIYRNTSAPCDPADEKMHDDMKAAFKRRKQLKIGVKVILIEFVQPIFSIRIEIKSIPMKSHGRKDGRTDLPTEHRIESRARN